MPLTKQTLMPNTTHFDLSAVDATWILNRNRWHKYVSARYEELVEAHRYNCQVWTHIPQFGPKTAIVWGEGIDLVWTEVFRTTTSSLAMKARILLYPLLSLLKHAMSQWPRHRYVNIYVLTIYIYV